MSIFGKQTVSGIMSDFETKITKLKSLITTNEADIERRNSEMVKLEEDNKSDEAENALATKVISKLEGILDSE